MNTRNYFATRVLLNGLGLADQLRDSEHPELRRMGLVEKAKALVESDRIMSGSGGRRGLGVKR